MYAAPRALYVLCKLRAIDLMRLQLTNGKPALAHWIGDVETRFG